MYLLWMLNAGFFLSLFNCFGGVMDWNGLAGYGLCKMRIKMRYKDCVTGSIELGRQSKIGKTAN